MSDDDNQINRDLNTRVALLEKGQANIMEDITQMKKKDDERDAKLCNINDFVVETRAMITLLKPIFSLKSASLIAILLGGSGYTIYSNSPPKNPAPTTISPNTP